MKHKTDAPSASSDALYSDSSAASKTQQAKDLLNSISGKIVTHEQLVEQLDKLDTLLEEANDENSREKQSLFQELEKALTGSGIKNWDKFEVQKLKTKWEWEYKKAEEKKAEKKEVIASQTRTETRKEGIQKTEEGKSLSDATFQNLFPGAPFSNDDLKYVLGDQDIKRAVGRALNGENFDATSADLGNLFSDTDKELAGRMHKYLKSNPKSQAAFLSYIGKDTNIIPFFGTDDAEQNTVSIKQLGEKAKNAAKDNRGTVKYEKNEDGEGKLQIDTKKNTQLNALIGGEDEREGLWGDVVNPTVLASVIAGRDLQTVYRNITWNKNDTIQFNDTKDILEARKNLHDALVIFSKISADSAGGSGLAALADGNFDSFFKKVHAEHPDIKVDLRDMQMSDTVINLAMMLGGIGIAVATEWALLANGEIQTVSSDEYAQKRLDKAKNSKDGETDGSFLDWANTKVLKQVKDFILGRNWSWRPGEEQWTKDFEANTTKMAQDLMKLAKNKNGSFDTSKIPTPELNRKYIENILNKTKAYESLPLEQVQKLILSTYIQEQAQLNQGHDIFGSLGLTGIGIHLDTLGVDGEAVVENKQVAGIESEFTGKTLSTDQLKNLGIEKRGNTYILPTEMSDPQGGIEGKLPVHYGEKVLTDTLSIPVESGKVPHVQVHKNEDAPYIEVKMVPGKDTVTLGKKKDLSSAVEQTGLQNQIDADISHLPENWTRQDKKRTRQEIISALQGGNTQGAFDALKNSSVKEVRDLHSKYQGKNLPEKALVAESVVNSGVVHVNTKKKSTVDSVMAKENKNTRYEKFENTWLEHSGLKNVGDIKNKWLAQNKGKEYSASGQQANGFGFMMNGSRVDGVYGRSSLGPTAHVVGDLLPLAEKEYNQFLLTSSILQENKSRVNDIRDTVNTISKKEFTLEQVQNKLLGMDVAGLEQLETSLFFGRFKECANGAVLMKVSFAGRNVEYTASASDSATFNAPTAEVYHADLVATPAPLVRELTEGGGQGESVPTGPTTPETPPETPPVIPPVTPVEATGTFTGDVPSSIVTDTLDVGTQAF